MKKNLILFFFIASNVVLFGQEKTKRILSVSLGYIHHYNNLNEDGYYDYSYSSYRAFNEELSGFNLRFELATEIENLSLIFGSVYENTLNRYYDSPTFQFLLNGGGIYFGLNPEFGNKTFGFYADVAAGIFSYKNYIAIYGYPLAEQEYVYDKRASGGFGGMLNVGVYLRVWRLGIEPSFNLIYSGGSNASFTFYGLHLPISYRF